MIKHRTPSQRIRREDKAVRLYGHAWRKAHKEESPYPHLESMANGVTQALFGLFAGSGMPDAALGMMSLSAYDMASKVCDCDDYEPKV